jgi:hypothetical protein
MAREAGECERAQLTTIRIHSFFINLYTPPAGYMVLINQFVYNGTSIQQLGHPSLVTTHTFTLDHSRIHHQNHLSCVIPVAVVNGRGIKCVIPRPFCVSATCYFHHFKMSKQRVRYRVTVRRGMNCFMFGYPGPNVANEGHYLQGCDAAWS